MPDPILDRIHLWRHYGQALLREERARLALEAAIELAGEDTATARRAQAALDTAGAVLNAAILALDEDMRPGAHAPVSLPDPFATRTT